MGKEPIEKERHTAATSPYKLSSSGNTKLASRSCNACYQRKVRCDRGVPCTNCEKHGVACVYPTKPAPDAEGIVPVKKGPSLQNISNRLERVESLLTRLVERSEGLGSFVVPLPSRTASEKERSVHIDTPPCNASSPRTGETDKSQQSQQTQQGPSTTWEILLNDERDERSLPFVGTPSSGNTPQSSSINVSHSTL